MITRRRFLKIAGYAAAPLTIGAFAARTSITRAVDRLSGRLVALVLSPGEQLRAHFSYLTLDGPGVGQYLADYQGYRGRLPRFRPLSAEFYTRYLMSTDFFRTGADESRTVRYVGFYDPDETPCSNPFAELDRDIPDPS
jgi:hypothetical protein